jgi:hypothetical protein
VVESVEEVELMKVEGYFNAQGTTRKFPLPMETQK